MNETATGPKIELVDKKRELTPAEVIDRLTKMKDRYCREFGEKTVTNGTI